MVEWGNGYYVRGSLTCSASAICSLDATSHTDAVGVNEPQNHMEKNLLPLFWINMHCYPGFTLQGRQSHTDSNGTALSRQWVMGVRRTDESQAGRLSQGNGLIIKEQARQRKQSGPPFTYSHSKTQSQVLPPPRSGLLLGFSPCFGELSNAT